MSLFINSWILSLTVGAIAFVLVYLNFDRIFQFLSDTTIKNQQEILAIMDKLLIARDHKKVKKSLWITSIAFGLLIFVLFWPRVIVSCISGVIVFLGTWYVIKIFFRKLWERHCDTVVSQMVEVLTLMCNSLKVGLSLGQAMERVLKGYPGALAREFGLVLNKMRLGQNLEEALEEMAERIQRDDVNMLVSTVNILKETGGNLAETFFVMAETLRERQKMEKKIKALTAQAMTQAKILSVLPFALVIIFYFLDREYISPLLFNPIGWACLVLVLILVLVGSFLMRKMAKIEV